MKFEMKMFLLSLVFSILCVSCFTYAARLTQKTIYVYQVGIYKEEENKNKKLKDIQKEGFEGYFYEKNNQYYVLSLMSESKKEIQRQSHYFKGIIKSYVVSFETSYQKLLDKLSKGEFDDQKFANK